MLFEGVGRRARRFCDLRILALAALVALGLGHPAWHAAAQSDETTGTDGGSGGGSGGDADVPQEVGDYFSGNVLFVFFHELGHGLIDKLQLPVLGKEEDAADQLATLMLLDAGEDSVGGTPALTAALGWLDSWNKREAAPDDSDYWDEHSLDMQRYANIVCLVYGSDPDKYADMVKDWEMSEARAERCPAEFDSAQASWTGVTEGAWLPDDQTAPAGNRAFTIEYKPAEHDEYREIADESRRQQVLAGMVDKLNQRFILPSPIKIVMRECGEENAFYTAETSELTMCYELLAMFLADAEKQTE